MQPSGRFIARAEAPETQLSWRLSCVTFKDPCREATQLFYEETDLFLSVFEILIMWALFSMKLLSLIKFIHDKPMLFQLWLF